MEKANKELQGKDNSDLNPLLEEGAEDSDGGIEMNVAILRSDHQEKERGQEEDAKEAKTKASPASINTLGS